MHHPILPLSRILTLAGYAILFITLLLGIVLKKIHSELPEGFLIIIWIVPLLFPLRGLLQAKRYTHAWGSFLACWYLVVGVDLWQANPAISATVLMSTTIWFTGMVLFARFSPFDWKVIPRPRGK
ncbi:DUF2069 domain-containing protein [Wohlfahrtiimonas chitiniclastica]|uniref:DUF2069 domain-containing protein n=1 Tax=Wohlfahrtiimonas chitiniclastica TaxID=400946 RepID=A0A165HRG1_9GAMM|nr:MULTISPECIES: DUF2069 domain-containing protein [Wohlfahrtiimonas]KZS24015.1 hypothetical protein BMY_1894 [Wohlfahrtiimonas chitiniclastica]KZX37626.1 hypothetical protein A6V30_01725 [Wohlfahrtiimonas chitiniclastica]MBS7817675.1 DUF2069 domain-containing protein [Wohlfahrtiimonas chitiniclastica]MBS7819564.1 DUF2069 domain-containing protein [Wohlfahrtiimonas chitiniclastica]MBS7820666.1 DUF2069 domain-containing protein [Wohlfahrtiimonas chitiniclastica]